MVASTQPSFFLREPLEGLVVWRVVLFFWDSLLIFLPYIFWVFSWWFFTDSIPWDSPVFTTIWGICLTIFFPTTPRYANLYIRVSFSSLLGLETGWIGWWSLTPAPMAWIVWCFPRWAFWVKESCCWDFCNCGMIPGCKHRLNCNFCCFILLRKRFLPSL